MANATTHPGNEIKILLVEDDEVDVELLRRAFTKHGIANEVVVAGDGPEALSYLGSLSTNDRAAPAVLVLLDLNLPTMGGLEVLETVRSDERLRRSVIFVLSTSERERDKRAAYDMNVAGYLVKGKLGPALESLCRLIQSYCDTNRFPSPQAIREGCMPEGSEVEVP